MKNAHLTGLDTYAGKEFGVLLEESVRVEPGQEDVLDNGLDTGTLEAQCLSTDDGRVDEVQARCGEMTTASVNEWGRHAQGLCERMNSNIWSWITRREKMHDIWHDDNTEEHRHHPR